MDSTLPTPIPGRAGPRSLYLQSTLGESLGLQVVNPRPHQVQEGELERRSRGADGPPGSEVLQQQPVGLIVSRQSQSGSLCLPQSPSQGVAGGAVPLRSHGIILASCPQASGRLALTSAEDAVTWGPARCPCDTADSGPCRGAAPEQPLGEEMQGAR